jgi:hypothetical protein
MDREKWRTPERQKIFYTYNSQSSSFCLPACLSVYLTLFLPESHRKTLVKTKVVPLEETAAGKLIILMLYTWI